MAEKTYEAVGGLRRSVLERDDAVRFQADQNVDGVIEHCKAMRERVPNTHGRDLVPVAEIPLAIYEKAVHEGWHNDPAAWRRWLSDPDNKPFRIWTGRHR